MILQIWTSKYKHSLECVALPCLSPAAGVAAAVVVLGVVGHALVAIETGTGLQTQAPP